MRRIDEQFTKTPLFWGPPDDGLVEDSGLYSEPEAGRGADAADGVSGYFYP